MTTLWSMGPSMASAERLDELIDREPTAFEWTNRTLYADVVMSRGGAHDEYGLPLGQVRGVDLSDLPSPHLRCTEPDFTPDLIFWGELFASARLLEALALDSVSAQLIPVDCADCPLKMRARGYHLLNLKAFANPMDRERSAPAEFAEFRRDDGGTDHVWLFRGAGPAGPAPRIVWRDGFVSPAPLFRVPGISWTLATEELAARVAAAGLSDIAFHDLTRGDALVARE